MTLKVMGFAGKTLYTDAVAKLGLNKKPKFRTKPLHEGSIFTINTDHCPTRESYLAIHRPGNQWSGFLEYANLKAYGPWGSDGHFGPGTPRPLDRDNSKPFTLKEVLACRDQLRIISPWLKFKAPPLTLESIFELLRPPEWIRLTITQHIDFPGLGQHLDVTSEFISEGNLPQGFATYEATFGALDKDAEPIVANFTWPGKRVPSAALLQQRWNREDGREKNPRITIKKLWDLESNLKDVAKNRAEGQGKETYKFELFNFSADDKKKKNPDDPKDDDREPTPEEKAKAEAEEKAADAAKAAEDKAKDEAANEADKDDPAGDPTNVNFMVGGTITG